MQMGRGELLEEEEEESDNDNTTTTTRQVSRSHTANNNNKFDRRRRQGVLIQSARFLRNELPIRLAHRSLDLDAVPLMRDMPSVQRASRVFIQTAPVLEDSAFHARCCYHGGGGRSLGADAARLVCTTSTAASWWKMARGAYELRQGLREGEWKLEGSSDNNNNNVNNNGDHAPSFERWADCHNFLDRFYTSRIGIRVLAGQYLALRDPSPQPQFVVV
jgi:pyruvate dehydrogenase kinase 2/3/4